MSEEIKKHRSDKEKNRIKVITEVIKDPLASEREIAERVWLWKTTIHEHLQEIPNTTKSDHIEAIIAKDLEVVDKAQEILLDRLNNKPDDISTRDIIASADVSAKRYSLFKWDATDKNWGVKDQKMVIEIINSNVNSSQDK